MPAECPPKPSKSPSVPLIESLSCNSYWSQIAPQISSVVAGSGCRIIHNLARCNAHTIGRNCSKFL